MILRHHHQLRADNRFPLSEYLQYRTQTVDKGGAVCREKKNRPCLCSLFWFFLTPFKAEFYLGATLENIPDNCLYINSIMYHDDVRYEPVRQWTYLMALCEFDPCGCPAGQSVDSGSVTAARCFRSMEASAGQW